MNHLVTTTFLQVLQHPVSDWEGKAAIRRKLIIKPRMPCGSTFKHNWKQI